MSPFHDSILAAAQRRLLAPLGAFATPTGHYLAGGTAIALQIGHRESVDFDFFGAAPTVRGPALAERLRRIVPGVETTDEGPDHWNGVVDGVKVSFFVYPYPLLDAALLWESPGVEIASLRDLAAMKLAAIAQRGHRRDFIDLDALLARGTRLSEVVADYRAKYRLDDVMNLRLGLTFFDDADAQPDPRMLGPFSWPDAKRRIGRAARDLA